MGGVELALFFILGSFFGSVIGAAVVIWYTSRKTLGTEGGANG